MSTGADGHFGEGFTLHSPVEEAILTPMCGCASAIGTNPGFLVFGVDLNEEFGGIHTLKNAGLVSKEVVV
jgi:hypothetical protein